MAVEIERKFLALPGPWRDVPGVPYSQGYLNREPDRTVRVRVAGERGFLTVKGRSHGATRAEFEYEIPVSDAQAMLALCDGPLVQKRRHTVQHGGLTWEVDEFDGDNAGLVVAEVELEREDQPFEPPPWLGREVTDDPRYFNANLATHPYSRWREDDAAAKA